MEALQSIRHIPDDPQVLHIGSQTSDNVAMLSMIEFRFQPMEGELLGFYLRSMVAENRSEAELIYIQKPLSLTPGNCWTLVFCLNID